MAGGDQQPAEGNQIFVTLRRGKAWPPQTCDVRIKYEQTILDVKKAVAAKTNVPVEKQQLFLRGAELTPAAYDAKTLMELNMHTGFALQGYDLAEEPDYWPPVRQTPEGLVVETADTTATTASA